MANERNCIYVASRGLLKSCDIRSPKPRSSGQTELNYLYDLHKHPFDGMTVYVCTDNLPTFAAVFLPHIKHQFVLVSGDSDESLEPSPITDVILNHPMLVRWFAQNNLCPNVTHLPIGLDFHTIAENANHPWCAKGEGASPLQQQHYLMQVRDKARCWTERSKLIYAQFTLGNDAFGQRAACLRAIPPNLMHHVLNFTTRTQCWNNMAEHAFVLCPAGNGLDCHRNWEAMALSCIPIMLRQPGFSELYAGLPVLLVDDWADVTLELLDSTLADFTRRAWNMSKLSAKYWLNQMHEMRS
jgi:hypothetical protein